MNIIANRNIVLKLETHRFNLPFSKTAESVCFLISDVWLLQLIYLPPPWGDCKVTAMDSDFFDSYSITACRIDCETRYLVDNCNCRMVHMPGRKPLVCCARVTLTMLQ